MTERLKIILRILSGVPHLKTQSETVLLGMIIVFVVVFKINVLCCSLSFHHFAGNLSILMSGINKDHSKNG